MSYLNYVEVWTFIVLWKIFLCFIFPFCYISMFFKDHVSNLVYDMTSSWIIVGKNNFKKSCTGSGI